MSELTTKDALLERMVTATENLATNVPAKFEEYLPINAATTVATTGLTVDPAYGSLNDMTVSTYGKVCTLRATLKITTAPTGAFATVDAAYRPAASVIFPVKIGGTSSNKAINLWIDSNGEVKPYLSTMETSNYFVFTITYLLP